MKNGIDHNEELQVSRDICSRVSINDWNKFGDNIAQKKWDNQSV